MSTRIISLNPFGTGQCLSTKTRFHCCSIFESQSLWNRAVSFDQYPKSLALMDELVSIPLEQGSVFRQNYKTKQEVNEGLNPFGTGQCLSTVYKIKVSLNDVSQSLWNRAVSFDCSGILKPCGTRLTRATSQLFPRLRELGLDLIKCCTSFNILFTYQAVENGRDFTRVFRFY